MSTKSGNIIRYSLGIILFIVAVNAFAGGYYGLVGAKNVPIEWLMGSPFKSYFIPSLILFTIVGGSSLVAAIAVLIKRKWAKTASIFAGLIMLIWIGAQLSIIGYVSWLQPAILACGVATIALATQLKTTLLFQMSRRVSKQ
ncbi:MAG TPA: hypothetical protein PL009_13345 [Flavipsychrobacter sp.]|nr:hypothetical protein [Flavipsychrobacter sp.]